MLFPPFERCYISNITNTKKKVRGLDALIQRIIFHSCNVTSVCGLKQKHVLATIEIVQK